MRSTRRILSFLLAAAMITACFAANVFAASAGNSIFSDVTDSDSYVTAVGTLNGLGVINGYEDGTFRPLQNVTRAEFTAMLMRTLNFGSLGSTSAANLPFTDIDDNDSDINWSIPNINTAYDKGIINGYEDGTFRPNDDVAYEEAVKMIVCTLGYTDIDISGTPWYGQYIAQANKLGILSGASSLGAAETPASRACIAQMLYDSLDVNIVEQGSITKKTILSDYLGYAKNTGIISSDGITSMDSPDVDLNSNEVQIRAYEESTGLYETYTYKTSNDSLKNYLGHQIEFYYKSNGSTRTLMLYVLKQNKVLDINASLIEEGSSSSSQVKYYKSADDNTLSTITLNSDNVVIYNGKLYGSNASSSRFDVSMIPKVGTVSFIDSDADDRYDLVNIQGYEIYYVSSKVASEYYIVDDLTRTGDDKKLYLDVEDGTIETTIVNSSGSTMEYSSIATGSIICLARSQNTIGKQVQKAVVLTNTVSGTITGTGKDSVTISGKEYKYSNAAPWMPGNSGTLSEPALEDSGVYCLDINGDIVAYKKNAVTENVYYGYIMGIVDPQSSFDDEKIVRILNQNGSEATINLTKSTKIDGQSYSSVSDLVDALRSSARLQNQDPDASNVSVHQMIKYTTKVSSGSTILDKIYTAAASSSGSEVVSDELHLYSAVTGADDMKYNITSKQLTGNGVTVNISNAIVFIVPSARNDYDGYKKSTLASTFKSGQSYNVDVFDVSKTNYAQVVVCYGVNASTDVDSLSPVNVISEDVANEINPDTNTSMPYLRGYSALYSNAKGTLEAWNSSESTWTPKLGDIFRAGTDRDGNMKILEENVIYSVDRSDNEFGVLSPSNPASFYSAECAIIMGSVVAVDDNAIAIIPEKLGDGDVVEDITSKSYSFSISDFSGARIVKYDTSGKKLQVNDVSSEYEGIIKGLVTYEDGVSNPTKVMLYMYDSKVRLFCILGENI